MTDTLDMVREFHEAFDLHVTDVPTMPRQEVGPKSHLHGFAMDIEDLAERMLARAKGDDSGYLMRLHLYMEELGELAWAMAKRDAVEALDALCDMRYVADGTTLHLGLGNIFDAAMTEVHASNMSKLVDGKPVKNDAGRVLKLDTYFKPDLEPLVKGNFDGQPEAPNVFWNELGRWPSAAPQGDEGPPWGIHSSEGEDAHQSAPLPDQEITYAFGDATREFVKNHVERSQHHLKSISTLLDAHHV